MEEEFGLAASDQKGCHFFEVVAVQYFSLNLFRKIAVEGSRSFTECG
ncbi:MAG: hypothetical protein ACU85E_01530 [Gammaproteobacteria bacterium]